MNRKPPATKAVVRKRVEEILRIRLDGAEFWDIREFVREKEVTPDTAWTLAEGSKPLSDASLWRYIAQANQLIEKSCLSSRKKLMRRHLAQRRNLYAKAVSQGDNRTALAVLRDEAELQGLYPPKKVAPTDPTGTKEYAPRSSAERDAAFMAILDRARARNGPGDPDSAADESEGRT